MKNPQIELLNTMINEKQDAISPTLKMISALEDQRDELIENEEKVVLEANKELVDRFNEMGAEDVFVEINKSEDFRRAVEDDGTLHITIGQVRGCFICNQDIRKAEWNRQATPILKAFGFSHKDLN